MINTTTVTISPSKAEKMLEMNINNRPVSERHVDFLAGEIKAGNWKLNGESIKVGRDRIIDGQHRLYAIIRANKAIKTLVSTGLADDVFDTVDTGRNRTGSDILALRGEGYVTALSAMLLLTRRYYKQKNFGERGKVSNVELEKLLEEFPECRDFAGVGPKCTGLIAPRVIEFCYYVFSKVDKDDADKFIEQVCTGNNLPNRHPILALRNKIITAKLSGNKFHVDATIHMMFKAWSMVRAGKRTSRIAYKPGDKLVRAK